MYASRQPGLAMDDPNAEIVEIPETGPTVKAGLHYLLPVVILVWFLTVERFSPGLSPEELLEIMGLIARHNGLFAAHCENGPILDLLEDAAVGRGDVRPEHYPPTHPGIAEADFPDIIAKSKNSSSMKGNPLTLTESELRSVLHMAL